MTALYWLLQSSSDLPTHNHWLTRNECNSLAKLRFEKRRADWRLGRWTAKHALAASPHIVGNSLSFNDIEIYNDTGGAPHARCKGGGENCALSISHRGGTSLCAVAPPSFSIGCDLELIEERSAEFVADYFTATERRFVYDSAVKDKESVTALIWSAKESALKALAVGLRFDTRAVEVTRYGWNKGSLESWQPLLVCRTEGEGKFHGWWCAQQDRVLTILAAPQANAPVRLHPISTATS